MKKLFLLAIPLLILFTACSDDDGPLDSGGTTGNLFISSNPSGAAIYIDGVNTNKTTPDTVEVEEGVKDVELRLDGYTNYTTQVSVSAGQTSVLGPIEMTALGSIVVNSTPPGAAIILDGVNTGFGTPATISNLIAGDYEIKLQFANYEEFTQVVTVTDGVEFQLNANLVPVYSTFSSVKIWETTGTTADQPSGVDLSTGEAYGISTDNRVNVDIYYFSASDGSTYLVQSASEHSNMTRETLFFNGGATNLNDGADSPVATNSWAVSMSDRESNYFFLYDQDGNYSKLKISDFGGGTGPGDPAWVELDWIYNTASEDRQF